MTRLDPRTRWDIALPLALGLQASVKRTVCTYCRGSGQQPSDGCCVASTVCPHCGGEMYEPLKRSEIEAAIDKIVEALRCEQLQTLPEGSRPSREDTN